MSTTITVHQGTASSSDEGWANDAYYLLDRAGFCVREGVDGCTSWEECSDTDEDGEFVTMRVHGDAAELAAAIELLTTEGFAAALLANRPESGR